MNMRSIIQTFILSATLVEWTEVPCLSESRDMVTRGKRSTNDSAKRCEQVFEMLPITLSLSFLNNFGGTTSQNYTKIFTGILQKVSENRL